MFQSTLTKAITTILLATTLSPESVVVASTVTLRSPATIAGTDALHLQGSPSSEPQTAINPLFSPFARAKNTANTDDLSRLVGTWKLDEQRSDSFVPILKAAGAPKLLAGTISKVLNRDVMDLTLSKKQRSVDFYSRQMKRTISYNQEEITSIKTPKGNQYGRILERHDNKVVMERLGPKKGERMVDIWSATDDDDELVYHTIHQAVDGTETRARRVFVRERSE